MWHKSSYLRSLTVIGWCLGLVDRLVESLYHALVGLRSLIVYPNFSSIFKGMMFIADPQSNMILGTGMSSRLLAINKGRLCNLVPSNKSSSENSIEQHWAVDVSIFATSAWVSSRKKGQSGNQRLSKIFRWAMTLYLILSGEAVWLGGAWYTPTEGAGGCTSGNWVPDLRVILLT